MSVENYSEVILRQKHGVEDTLAKIVQDRKVHEVELDNIYTEGVRDLVHPKFLDSLQEKIMKREMTNHNKGQVDAMEWSKHDNSLLERLSGRLEGGDVTPRLHKNLRYTAKRGNSFFLNLNKKLHQDRGIHMRELEQVVYEAKRSGVSPQFVTFLDKTLENRKLYNSRKTALDVAQWEQLDTGVSRLLKNDSQKVLSAGAFPTEISGGFRMTELQKQNYRTAKKLIRGGGIEVQYDPKDKNMFYILIEKSGDGDGKYMSFFLNKEGECVKLELLMHEQNIHRKNFKKVEISEIEHPILQKEISQYITENFY